jgi:hypothetical protein
MSRAPTRWFASAAVVLVALLAGAGCAVTPDPCAGYPQACLAVTVEQGPADTYQLLVAVLDGYGSTTPVTPRRRPAAPLVYPLRFAIRFDEFDAAHTGSIRFTVESLNATGDSNGFMQQTVALVGDEHRQVSVSLGAPLQPDLSSTPDLSSPDQAHTDGGGPLNPVDQAPAGDLHP